MKLLYLFLFIIIVNNENSCAQDVLIKGSVYPIPAIHYLTILSSRDNPVSGSSNIVLVVPVDRVNKFNSKLTLKKPSLLYFQYGSRAYELFVSPRDTINIDFLKKEKPDTVHSGNFTSYYFEKINVTGKNVEEIMFFDSLLTYTNRRFGNPLYPSESNLMVNDAINLIDQNYLNELDYLKVFSKRHDLSDELIECANNEIRGDYILKNISQILRNEYNNEAIIRIKNKITEEKFTWAKCSVSRLFTVAAIMYVRFFLTEGYSLNKNIENRLQDQYNAICKNFNDDIELRNYLLTNLMERNLEKTPTNYKFYLNEYYKTCTNKEYIKGISDQYQALLKKIDFGIDSVVSNQKVLTPTGKKIYLRDVIKKGTPLLIDFWASWCGPCIIQMPYAKKFENKYKDRVNYIYISVDKSISNWKSAIAKHNLLGDHYLMPDGFSTSLSKYLDLKSIPRIVLFDKNGKIYSYSLTAPSSESSFDSILKNCLLK